VKAFGGLPFIPIFASKPVGSMGRLEQCVQPTDRTTRILEYLDAHRPFGTEELVFDGLEAVPPERG